MATYDKTNIWDGVAAQIFEGAVDGTDIGMVGEVSIVKEEQFLDVKVSHTGEQIIDRKRLSTHYKVSIDFREIGEANHFANWWFAGHPDGTAAGKKLHKGTVGDSVPTKRLRVHPRNQANEDKDWVFDFLAIESGPTATMNGKGEHVHRITLVTLPDPTALGTSIELGQQGWTLTP